MELDFGGVVKEYAVDRAATLCREAGIKQALINLGGDIRLVGPRLMENHGSSASSILANLDRC
jgi:thiamine biosynthesis lipoprotein